MRRLTVRALDHVVLNVADVEASLRFYCETFGLPAERLAEFRAGTAPFPSARISRETIIDFFPPDLHDGDAGSSGVVNVNHIALTVDDAPEEIAAFLRAHDIEIVREAASNFGARGIGHAFYVRDPDGNVVELRSYAGG